MLNFILNFLFFLFFYLLFSMDHIVGNAFVLSGNGNTSVCISQNLCRTDLKSGSMWVRLSLNCLHVWMSMSWALQMFSSQSFLHDNKKSDIFLFFMSIKACTVYWLCKFLICKCPMFSYEEKSLKSKRRTFVFFKVSGTPNSCNNKS